MPRRILSAHVFGNDPAPGTVQDHDGKDSKIGRLRAYLGGRDTPFVVDVYATDGTERYLEVNHSAYPQSDAYFGYGDRTS